MFKLACLVLLTPAVVTAQFPNLFGSSPNMNAFGQPQNSNNWNKPQNSNGFGTQQGHNNWDSPRGQRTNGWYNQCVKNTVNGCSQECSQKSGMAQTKADSVKFCFANEIDFIQQTRSQCGRQFGVSMGEDEACWRLKSDDDGDDDDHGRRRNHNSQKSHQSANPFLSDQTVVPFLDCMNPCLKREGAGCDRGCTADPPANIPQGFQQCSSMPILVNAFQTVSCVFGAIGFGSGK